MSSALTAGKNRANNGEKGRRETVGITLQNCALSIRKGAGLDAMDSQYLRQTLMQQGAYSEPKKDPDKKRTFLHERSVRFFVFTEDP